MLLLVFGFLNWLFDAAVIAAVLLYRIVSAWALVPLGWGLWRTMPNAQLAQLESSAVSA